MGDIKIILTALAGAIVIVGVVFSSIYLVIKFAISKSLSRWSEALERMPPQRWFDKVESAVDKMAEQIAVIAGNTDAIVALRSDLKTVEDNLKDSDRGFTALKAQHDLIYSNCFHRFLGTLDSPEGEGSK